MSDWISSTNFGDSQVVRAMPRGSDTGSPGAKLGVSPRRTNLSLFEALSSPPRLLILMSTERLASFSAHALLQARTGQPELSPWLSSFNVLTRPYKASSDHATSCGRR